MQQTSPDWRATYCVCSHHKDVHIGKCTAAVFKGVRRRCPCKKFKPKEK